MDLILFPLAAGTTLEPSERLPGPIHQLNPVDATLIILLYPDDANLLAHLQYRMLLMPFLAPKFIRCAPIVHFYLEIPSILTILCVDCDVLYGSFVLFEKYGLGSVRASVFFFRIPEREILSVASLMVVESVLEDQKLSGFHRGLL